MTPYDLAHAILDRLAATGIQVLDDPADATDDLYCYLHDDAGTARRARLGGGSRETMHAPMVVCVGRDRDGARYVAGLVRGALTDWRVGGGHLTETAAGPALTDGPQGDRRTSMTLAWQVQTSRA